MHKRPDERLPAHQQSAALAIADREHGLTRAAPNREYTVAILGPFGFGNLGDAAIQEAVLLQLRARRPHVRYVGVSLNPADTLMRHGLETYAYDADTYSAVRTKRAGKQAHAPNPRLSSTRFAAGLKEIRAAFRWRTRGLRFVVLDAQHTAYMLVRLIRVNLLLVSGGGQIDEFWGGPWKHPYALFKWVLLARLAGVRVAFLSVGVGTVKSRLSRWFLRQALRLAHYRSYRDSGSRKLVNDLLGVGIGDQVVPDMAFGLPVEQASTTEPGDSTAVKTIAIGAMAYCDPRSWPVADSQRYGRYVEFVRSVCEHLISQGINVVLFVGEVRHDRATIDDLLRLLSAVGKRYPGTLSAPPIASVQELLSVLRTADVVIASRFHGTLLGLLLGRPVLAVSHERKVRQLMSDFGQEGLCIDIDEADLTAVRHLLGEMQHNARRIRVEVTSHAVRAHREVLRQFDAVAARFIPEAANPIRHVDP